MNTLLTMTAAAGAILPGPTVQSQTCQSSHPTAMSNAQPQGRRGAGRRRESRCAWEARGEGARSAGNFPRSLSRWALHLRNAGVAALAVLLVGCASSAREPESVGLLPLVGEDSVTTVSLMMGERWLDDDDDNTVDALGLDEQSVGGFEIDSYNRGSGNGFELGWATSWEDNTTAGVKGEVDMSEVYAGFRKTFMLDDQFHPFVSGGVSYVDGELDSGPASSDGSDLATYLRAGILWDLGDRLRLGLDYRYLFGGDVFGGLGDADYDQVALSLGYRF